MNNLYTYAVARVRALENSLFSNADIERIIATESYDEAIRFLQERGWGISGSDGTGESILAEEEEKIWNLIRELKVDEEKFAFLSIPKLYHNLKSAVKEAVKGKTEAEIYYEDTDPKGQEIREIIAGKEFNRLPESLRSPAEEAYNAMQHTGDGQLADIIIDKAALEAVYKAGKSSDIDIVRDYSESLVAIADIKIAARSMKTGKNGQFMKRAMAECDTLDIDSLIRAAEGGEADLKDYLAGTPYKEGAGALGESNSAFERWCDNRIIETIKPQKYNPFSLGPIVAYVLARRNEIKMVRIILSAKENGLSGDAIKERVREMYV
jgi:V/A-type H+-transporting ATPase subunit C